MKPPTLKEVRDYISFRNLQWVIADEFWNFYDSNGWMVGKNPMKKWRSAVAGWNAREKRKRKPKQPVIERCGNCGSEETVGKYMMKIPYCANRECKLVIRGY